MSVIYAPVGQVARSVPGSAICCGLLFMTAVYVASTSVPALAQTVPSTVVPSTIDPSRVRDRVQPQRSPRSRGTVIGTPANRKPKVDPRLKNVKFDLKAIRITGSQAVPAAELRSLYATMLRRKVSLAEVFALANRITAAYRNRGYILSQAVVPRQRIQNGTIRIHVIEGYVDRVVLQGSEIFGRLDVSRLQAMGNRIARVRPLTRAVLERYLLLANDVPGLTVKGVLKASKTKPGAADLVLIVTQKHYDFWATFDNRGTRFAGPYQLEAGAAVNSLARLGDRTSVRVLSSIFQPKELGFYELRHQQPIGTDGLTVGFSGSYTITRPGFTLKPFKIRGRSYTLALTARYPILRSRLRNLNVHAAAEWRHSENRLLGINLSNDRTRQIRLGLTYDWVDRWRGVSMVDVTLHKGLDILGARGESRFKGRTNYTKFTALIQRNQHLYKQFSGFVAVTGQVAATRLLSSEEFGFGGRRFGGAFDSSTITGDHGFAVKGELRFSERAPFKIFDQKLGYQLFTYIDWGRVWHIEHQDRAAFDSAASFGIGVRFNLGKHISGQVQAAKPFIGGNDSLGTKRQSWRMFFSLSARY